MAFAGVRILLHGRISKHNFMLVKLKHYNTDLDDQKAAEHEMVVRAWRAFSWLSVHFVAASTAPLSSNWLRVTERPTCLTTHIELPRYQTKHQNFVNISFMSKEMLSLWKRNKLDFSSMVFSEGKGWRVNRFASRSSSNRSRWTSPQPAVVPWPQVRPQLTLWYTCKKSQAKSYIF